ncbi:MAG: hypothetical protein AAGI28_17315 [Pseudomonadota bacterium]
MDGASEKIEEFVKELSRRRETKVHLAALARMILRSLSYPVQLNQFSQQQREFYLLQCFRAALLAKQYDNHRRTITTLVDKQGTRLWLMAGNFQFHHNLGVNLTNLSRPRTGIAISFRYGPGQSHIPFSKEANDWYPASAENTFYAGHSLGASLQKRFIADLDVELTHLSRSGNAQDLMTKPLSSRREKHSTRFQKLFGFLFDDEREEWRYWRQWYESHLLGDIADVELERRIANIREETWNLGANAVASEIERIQSRREVEVAHAELKASLNARTSTRHGIGGNDPPESIEDKSLSGAIKLIWEAEEELSTALEAEHPERERIEAIVAKLNSGLASFLKWCASKGDLAVDKLIKWGIPATGAGYAVKYPEKIEALIEAIERWLPFLS